MITIRYFASLREQFQADSEELEWRDIFTDVQNIKSYLAQRNPHWNSAFADNDIFVAVNQQMSNKKTAVNDGDEIAFFPPVTGG